MNIKSYILLGYRGISFSALVLLFLGIIWYAVGFVLMSGGLSNWSIPIVLSPTQERVLSFQPQVANLEASVLRQRVEKATAEAKIAAGEVQLERIDELLTKISQAQKVEASALTATNKSINVVMKDKTLNIKQTEKIISDTQHLLKLVDEEEAAKLITKDQAAQRRIQLQNAFNQATDARAQLIQLSEQERQSRSAASTLVGGGTSLQALQSLQQEQQLIMTKTQLEMEVQTAKSTVAAITTNLSELERVLDTAKQAPQYRALRETVRVLFAPYTSLDNVEAGHPVYDCFFMYFACSKVGTVLQVYSAEEYARHPFLKTDLKGKFVEIQYLDFDASKSQVVFIRRKPLFL